MAKTNSSDTNVSASGAFVVVRSERNQSYHLCSTRDHIKAKKHHENDPLFDWTIVFNSNSQDECEDWIEKNPFTPNPAEEIVSE